jgi:hypothetical protein
MNQNSAEGLATALIGNYQMKRHTPSLRATPLDRGDSDLGLRKSPLERGARQGGVWWHAHREDTWGAVTSIGKPH